jgi:transposase, IS6 family
MRDPSLLQWRYFEADLILLCAVRWSLRSALRERDGEALLREHGVVIDHTTVFRWGPCDAPELDRRCRPYRRATNDSERVDETSIKIKKPWYDRYRAVDSTGATLDFMRSAACDADAAERFFRQVREARPTTTPRVITVDQPAAYPPACEALQQARLLCETCRRRQCTYLNQVIEQDHRCVKRRVNSGLGFGTLSTAPRTIQGDEARHMFRNGHLERGTKGDVLAQHRIINQRCGLAA